VPSGGTAPESHTPPTPARPPPPPKDGTSVQARVVVGADGLLSPVREAWLADGGPTFDNRVIFRWG
jgi:2-polyprenyl-6-methoxyphenol hydroxylase-like FAD-dependent oxidoreductase